MSVDIDQRQVGMLAWLEQVVDGAFTPPVPASGDASFRRYFRIEISGKTAIVMDAPPKLEDCRPFIKVAQMLLDWGLNAPEILAQDLEQGYLLLGDLGGKTYLDVIDDESAATLYGDALRTLVQMQSAALKDGRLAELPDYDEALLNNEMGLFRDWFLEKHLGIELSREEEIEWQKVLVFLSTAALEQPRSFVHRDYHSRNLMVCDQAQGGNPGVLDFQDAQHGPLTYDLVSLLRDCYIDWPEEKLQAWLEEYQAQAGSAVLQGLEGESLRRAFDLMGAQRHLKAVGIFARLNHRDGKPGYLDDIPRTLGYLRQVAGQYPELNWLSQLLNGLVAERWSATAMS